MNSVIVMNYFTSGNGITYFSKRVSSANNTPVVEIRS